MPFYTIVVQITCDSVLMRVKSAKCKKIYIKIHLLKSFIPNIKLVNAYPLLTIYFQGYLTHWNTYNSISSHSMKQNWNELFIHNQLLKKRKI